MKNCAYLWIIQHNVQWNKKLAKKTSSYTLSNMMLSYKYSPVIIRKWYLKLDYFTVATRDSNMTHTPYLLRHLLNFVEKQNDLNKCKYVPFLQWIDKFPKTAIVCQSLLTKNPNEKYGRFRK